MQISRGQTNPVAVFFLLLPSSTLFYGDEGVVFNARGNLNFNAFFQKVPFGVQVSTLLSISFTLLEISFLKSQVFNYIFKITLFEKSNFCPKIQFLQNPNIFTSFSSNFFFDNFSREIKVVNS